jgi:hypothetical protein
MTATFISEQETKVRLMTIYGVSQTSGVERQLKIEKGIEGVILTLVDHAAKKEQGRISILADDFVAAVTDAPPEGASIQSLPSPHATKSQMHVQVRRNEVWLTMNSDAGESADIAVGFDDLQDALEGVLSRE